MCRLFRSRQTSRLLARTPDTADAEQISLVKVLDHEHNNIAELSLAEELQEFQRHWSGKSRLSAAARAQFDHSKQTHHVLVFSGTGGSHWRYHPDGLIVILSKGPTPVYQVEQPLLFNELLHIQTR